MSRLDRVRFYAEKRCLPLVTLKSDEDKQELFALAQTWIVAALLEQKYSNGVADATSRRNDNMDTTTLLIIVVIVLLLGGGGWYGRGRWY